MSRKRQIIGCITGALVCSIFALSAALAQAKPLPPTFCIDGSVCSPVPAPAARPGGVKWHPGHYMMVGRGNHDWQASGSQRDVRWGYYDSIGNSTAIKGVVLHPKWAQLEGNTRGDYTLGINYIRAELNKLKSLPVPKRLILRINDVGYMGSGGLCPSPDYFPSYIAAAGGLVQTMTESKNGYNVCLLKKWDATISGYFIDMMKALAAEFDNDPYLEAVIWERESAYQWETPPSGYSDSANFTQRMRVASEMAAAWKNTMVLGGANYVMGGKEYTRDYIAGLAARKNGNFNADTCRAGDNGCNKNDSPAGIWSDSIIRGTMFGTDYRGRIPIFQGVESSELGWNTVGPSGGYTPAQVFEWADREMKASHILWDRNEEIGTSLQRWSTGILPFITANPKVTNTACPSVYPACTTN